MPKGLISGLLMKIAGGGKSIFDERVVLPSFLTSARIPVCGLGAVWKRTPAESWPPGPDRYSSADVGYGAEKSDPLARIIIAQDYGRRIHEFQKEMGCNR